MCSESLLFKSLLAVYRWIKSGKLYSENPGGHHRIRGMELRKMRPKRNFVKSKRIILDDEDEATLEIWLTKAK